MSRPERNNVDYFPLYCKEGKSMHYIEQRYGNDGFATWIKILRALAVTNYHFLDVSDEAELMFLSSKCNIKENILIDIINDLCKLGEIDQELWQNEKIIFSQKFISSIEDAYKNRVNKCINLKSLKNHLQSLKK